MQISEEKRVCEERVKIGFYLNSSTIEKFRKLIQMKYKKYEKGLLSYELENAILNWLALHTQAQTRLNGSIPNPEPKVAIVFLQVKNYLLTHFYESLSLSQQVQKTHLDQAIMAVRGSDKRTLQKWLRIFVKFHLIKHTVGNLWEIAG